MTEIAEPEVTEREASFWRWAHLVAAFTQDKDHSLDMLIRQWQGICPDADDEQLATTVENLRSILRMGA